MSARASDTGHSPNPPDAGTGLEKWSDALDLRALANEYGTPLYIISEATLQDNFRRYVAAVGKPERVRYPIKANPSLAILETLAALGAGADCASRDEVWAALEAGIPITSVTYNSPAPDPRLATWLLRSGATVVADSPDLFTALRAAALRAPFDGRLFVRLSPGGLPGYREASEIHRFTAHGSANSPFGIPSETIVETLKDLPLPVTGLHLHVGTQMDNVQAFEAAMRFLHHTAELLHEATPHRISTLNLGGGLGIPFLEGQQFPTIDDLAAAIQALRDDRYTYEVEPGNSLVGNAVALLARLVTIKEMRGRRWGILDVGTDQLMKITMAGWRHTIRDADHRALPMEGTDALSGPLCFAGDVLLPATRLDGLSAGDALLVTHAGAYCEATSSRFNGRRGPPHVLIRTDGTSRLVRRAEDPFFQPAVQGHVPPEMSATAASGEVLDDAIVHALQSSYLHEGAAGDGYEFVEVRRIGPRAYAFEVTPRAAVDFISMPLALRIAGDACIVAVGHVMGWRSKAGPVWGTRLSMTYETMLPLAERLTCRVVVSSLRRVPRRGVAYTGIARFELGAGQVTGAVRVMVPAGRRATSKSAG